MHVIWMLVIGLTVGFATKVLVPKWSRGGIITTIMLGISGSLVAGYAGRAVGWYDGLGVVASILGAVLSLVIHRFVVDRRRGAA